MKVYRFAVHPAEDGYFFLQCINAPNLFTQARTLDEALFMARDVVKAMLQEEDVQIELTAAPDVSVCNGKRRAARRSSRFEKRRAVAA